MADFQRRLINEALSRDEQGDLKYSTVVWSDIKKSGKSAIGAAVTFYMGYHHPYSHLYCLANDGTQSADRIFSPIQRCIHLHKRANGLFHDLNPTTGKLKLPNQTTIEAVPCNAEGEAGAQPLMTTWSEIWGFNTPSKMRLWTEMTIPPTLYGRAIQWVESYAGERGKSLILEGLYDLGMKEGIPHPDFPDEPVWVVPTAKMLLYWNTTPRMPWQTDAYYADQRKKMSDAEFRRIHQNEWVSPVEAFVQQEWWDACRHEQGFAELKTTHTPVVIGVDAAYKNDCAALIAVSIHPDNADHVAVRRCKIYVPAQHEGALNLEMTVGKTLQQWFEEMNVVCVAYDEYAMQKMAQDYMMKYNVWFYPFSQHTGRAVADKTLYDYIMQRKIQWDGTDVNQMDRGQGVETLYKHVTQAGSESTKGGLRLRKLTQASKIDGAVALSMAVSRALSLNISNDEHNTQRLIARYQRGEITEQEFFDAIQRVQHG